MEFRLVRQDVPYLNLCWMGLIPWLYLLYMVWDGSQDDLLHGLLPHQGQPDRLVVMYFMGMESENF